MWAIFIYHSRDGISLLEELKISAGVRCELLFQGNKNYNKKLGLGSKKKISTCLQ